MYIYISLACFFNYYLQINIVVKIQFNTYKYKLIYIINSTFVYIYL